jgi:hypothetical protein
VLSFRPSKTKHDGDLIFGVSFRLGSRVFSGYSRGLRPHALIFLTKVGYFGDKVTVMELKETFKSPFWRLENFAASFDSGTPPSRRQSSI